MYISCFIVKEEKYNKNVKSDIYLPFTIVFFVSLNALNKVLYNNNIGKICFPRNHARVRVRFIFLPEKR